MFLPRGDGGIRRAGSVHTEVSERHRILKVSWLRDMGERGTETDRAADGDEGIPEAAAL